MQMNLMHSVWQWSKSVKSVDTFLKKTWSTDQEFSPLEYEPVLADKLHRLIGLFPVEGKESQSLFCSHW